jgi:hypothetical protein
MLIWLTDHHDSVNLAEAAANAQERRCSYPMNCGWLGGCGRLAQARARIVPGIHKSKTPATPWANEIYQWLMPGSTFHLSALNRGKVRVGRADPWDKSARLGGRAFQQGLDVLPEPGAGTDPTAADTSGGQDAGRAKMERLPFGSADLAPDVASSPNQVVAEGRCSGIRVCSGFGHVRCIPECNKVSALHAPSSACRNPDTDLLSTGLT